MAEERREPAIRVILMPRDTNSAGIVFGGVILSYLDQAGAVAARRLYDRKFVTVAMREVEFLSPVLVGDLVSFYAEAIRTGRTSVTVQVTVEAHRDLPGTPRIQVTTAEVVYVAVGPDGRPVPLVG